jgi:hypothetical protein
MVRKPIVPVVPGKDAPTFSRRDPCAACGVHESALFKSPALRPMPVEGIMTMLCVNFKDCCARYRAGLNPMQYAMKLRAGEKP